MSETELPADMSSGIITERDYNIAYTRRRFLKPMIDEHGLREMAELEKICFPPPENYTMKTLRMFVSLNGAGLIRYRDVLDDRPHLIAFHLFDCIAGELITLDVHPAFRRRGIGKALVKESTEKLKDIGHTHATCQIATTNKASLDLHKPFGFRAIKRLKNYYGPGRDAFLLRAKL